MLETPDFLVIANEKRTNRGQAPWAIGNEYNTDWGGLPALKKELQAIRDGGQVPMFYTDPILADDNTELGHKYGPKYGVMNPL